MASVGESPAEFGECWDNHECFTALPECHLVAVDTSGWRDSGMGSDQSILVTRSNRGHVQKERHQIGGVR
jgi:hypothetical protein